MATISPFDRLAGRCQIASMLRSLPIALLLLVPLAGCGPLNTAAFTMSEDVEAPPVDPDESVRNWLWEQQQPVAAGMQLSRPATMPGTSAFRASRWYVCLREPVAPDATEPKAPAIRETVMIIQHDRVLETIAGPSPYF